jgi:hypothetical protein
VDHLLKEAPHRHLVFTLPKVLRRPFFHHREALNDLSRLAWECLSTFMGETLGLKDGVPAAVQAIETSGEYLDANPHIHVIAADGLFRADGTFRPMPKYDEGAQIYLLDLWKRAVRDFALQHQFISPEMMDKILGWHHTGFSVFAERRVDFRRSDPASVAEMQHLARYIAKPPFALENITYQAGSEKVIYRGSGLHKWHRQNFETFDVLDFVAAVTAHVPNYRQRYVLYYGLYSNKTRGWMKKRGATAGADQGEAPTVAQRKYRQTWAMLIRLVYEVDPLKCNKCGWLMQVVAIINDRAMAKAILIRAGLWQDLAPRGPPIDLQAPPPDEIVREAWWDDLPADV